MSFAPAEPALDPRHAVVEQLRQRVAAMERRPAGEPIPTLAGLEGVLSMQAGSTYAVDSASLALALAAGASRAGEWVGFAGWTDFGSEAAAELGIALDRTVLVPDPGEHWLEVTAALVDVLRVVVLRPPASVSERTAGVLEARLRARSAALVVQGDWPRPSARVRTEQSGWSGPVDGGGRLEERRALVAVHRGSLPPRRAELSWPGVERVDHGEREVLRALG